MSTNTDMITKMFSKRKTGLTSPEVAAKLNMNEKTTRNILARSFSKVGTKECTITGIKRTCYHLAA